MLITNDFVFIHLQKCAGTFVRKFLKKTNLITVNTTVKHDSVRQIPEKHKGKKIIGVIRNPWDWYVSWYSFRHKEGHSPQFGDLFEGSFESFLQKIFFDRHGIRNDINLDELRSFGIGPYTGRYKNSYCCEDGNFANVSMIKMEDLYAGMISEMKLTVEQIKILNSMNKVNTSSHPHYSTLYTDKTCKWITDREQFIIHKYGYSFETSK